MSAAPLPKTEDALDREQELAELEEEAARLEADNQALRGEPATTEPPKRMRVRIDVEKGAYRGVDPSVRLEQALHASETAVADLAIENAILRSQQMERALARRRAAMRMTLPLCVVALDVAVTWGWLGNAGLMMMTLAVLGLGWGLLRLMDVIKPTARNRKVGLPPPYGDA